MSLRLNRGERDVLGRRFFSNEPIARGFVAALVIAGGVASVARAQARLPFVGDFESQDLLGWDREFCCSHSVVVVSDPVRAGNYAVEFDLHRDDPDVSLSRRSELALHHPVPARAERWYGFSHYLPSDWVADDSKEIVAQWHGTPDFDLGENWRSPPLALMTGGGRWSLARRWDANRVSNRGTVQRDETALGSYTGDQDRWTDWVVHARWNWDASGLVEVWKNQELVYRHEGPVGFNDAEGPYFKIGVYKWDWAEDPRRSTTTRRTFFVDEVRVAEGSAGRQAVSPPVGNGNGPGGVDGGAAALDAGHPDTSGLPSTADAAVGPIGPSPRGPRPVPPGVDGGTHRPADPSIGSAAEDPNAGGACTAGLNSSGHGLTGMWLALALGLVRRLRRR